MLADGWASPSAGPGEGLSIPWEQKSADPGHGDGCGAVCSFVSVPTGARRLI